MGNACFSGSPESRINNYLNASAFAIAPAYIYGDTPRTIPCYGPGLNSWDLSLYKDVHFERMTFRFQAEALNAFNTPEFGAPATKFGAVTFGQITRRRTTRDLCNWAHVYPFSMIRSFWIDPRKTRLRKWVFYIHFYAGLIAGLLFSVVGITGSMIVFVPELRVMEAPAMQSCTRARSRSLCRPSTTRSANPVRMITSRVSVRQTKEKVSNSAEKSLNFRSYAPNGDRIQTFIDQYTGAIICQYNYSHRFLQKIYELHDNLLAGLAGRKVNAWFAMLLLVISIAGLLLWWRGRKYWRLGLEYRIQASWKRQVWDMHNLGGFLFFLPLLLLAVTGIYYSYKSEYVAIASALTGGPATVRVPRIAGDPGNRRPLDEIIAASDHAAPDCRPTIIEFPKTPGGRHLRTGALSFRSARGGPELYLR